MIRPGRTGLRTRSVCFAALALLLPPASARAQDAAPPRAVSQGEVSISCEAFGVGDIIRPGEWAGVRLTLTDAASRPRAVAVCFWQPDPDGDTALATREITLNPGVAQSVWIYTPLDWRASAGGVHTVTVHALGEGSLEGVGATASGARQIASAKITAGRAVKDADSMIGVLGPSPAAGLVRYSAMLESTDTRPVSAHELTEVVTGLIPADMPDRWMGLAQFESIVWLSGDPLALSESAAEALQEWVERGGRLVISLPSTGQAWFGASANPLGAILPDVRLDRIETPDARAIRALLSPRDPSPLASGAVYALRPNENAASGLATVLLTAGGGDAGPPLVVRRAHGAGSVTVIGIDLLQPGIAERVDPQFFWHRVLGKRFDVLSRDQMQAARGRAFIPMDMQAWVDSDIGPAIAKSGRAGVGVMLGIGLFAAYWLLAGPVGFAALKRRKLERHAWVVFVGAAAVFTVIAWGGAAALRPIKAEIQHLTVIDHVYGQTIDRARVWLSALLPTYGEQRVSIGNPDSSGRVHDAIRPWDAPSDVVTPAFPDARPYTLDAGAPRELAAPTRATVKSFRADWLGPPEWRGIAPHAGALRATDGGVEGTLVHDLPGAIADAQIWIVREQKRLSGNLGDGGPLLSEVNAWAVTGPGWKPGEPLDLSQFVPTTKSGRALDDLAKALSGSIADVSRAAASRADRVIARDTAISFHGALRQPLYLEPNASNPEASVNRRSVHGLDLSQWLTQPCVIVIGSLNNGPTPPLRIDGREVPTSGRTIYRWVYPLPSNPPRIAAP